MVEIWLPYGKTETFVTVNDENLLGILRPRDVGGLENCQQRVENILESSMDPDDFTRAVEKGKKVVVVVELANPTSQGFTVISNMLGKLSSKGVPSENTRILVTGGTSESIRADKDRFEAWNERFARYSVTEHNPLSSECVEVGKTDKGTKVFLNRVFVEADNRIVVSDVGLHRFLGYRGGCSAIIPGIASAETIRHSLAMLTNTNVRRGVLEGNPVHESIADACRLTHVDLALFMTTNLQGDVVNVQAGDLIETFVKASSEYSELCKIPFKQKGEIVIASAGGSPFDVDLYHATGGLDAALRIVKDGGAVIFVAECPKGYGNKIFYEWARQFKELKEIEGEIKKRYVSGGEGAYYLLKAREKARIYLVSVMPDYYASNVFKLKTARTTNSALQAAQRVLGKDSRIAVLPHAFMTLPTLELPPSDRT